MLLPHFLKFDIFIWPLVPQSVRTPISLRSCVWKQVESLAEDVKLKNSSLPKSEEKTESSECCSSWWCLIWAASKQCLAVLREDAAVQSNLSKMVTKEFWPENPSKMQTCMCGTLRNAGIALRNLQLGLHCSDSCYPLCIWMAFRVSSLTSLQIHLGSSFSPFTPLTSMLGKVKYETVNCYAICWFIRSLGRQPHFFLLSTAMPHTFTISMYDLVASCCLWRDALHCPLLFLFWRGLHLPLLC